MTYASEAFELAGKRIVREAAATGQFDKCVCYTPELVSDEVRNSKTFAVKRGGGLWCWKPDCIYSELQKMEYGDILLYCDSGCRLFPGREWGKYWRRLNNHDMIVQRLNRRMDCFCRSELIKEFGDLGYKTFRDRQFMATVVFLRKTLLTEKFISEWRNYMINRIELFSDVPPEMRAMQHKTFVESRHDQSIFSALVYRYLKSAEGGRRILTIWDHVEWLDLFSSQVIHAARWRGDGKYRPDGLFSMPFPYIIRFIINFAYRPFVLKPLRFIQKLKW